MPGVTHGRVGLPWKVPRGATLHVSSQGQSTLEDASVVGVLRVELERNTRGLLVREEATSLTDIKVTNGVTATQAHCREPYHVLSS